MSPGGSQVAGERSGDHAPDRFGSYVLGDLLGEGGMGRVFKAHTAEGQCVALKIVRPEMAREEVFRRRFAREVRAARSVSHPHVVAVVDDGEQDGTPYLAQQYMSGGSLAGLIESKGRLDLRETVRLCTDVAQGLDAIHAAGLVHRDVKPGNVLIDAKGRALVGDLGLVKLRNASVLTRQGSAVGSWHYMAPEQIRGEEVGPRTDVYSLGCVVQECLSGNPPFADREGMRVMWAHLQEQPTDPTLDREDLPDEVGWVIGLALAKEAEARPPTASALARMLQSAAGLLEGSP